MVRFLLLGIIALRSWAALRVGAADADITPPTGAPLAGYFSNRYADSTRYPLLARALVIENQETRLAWVTCDLTNMPRGIVEATRQLAARATGIPAANIMVSATHTHTAPVVLSGWTRYALSGQGLQIAEQYAAGLPGRIAGALIRAHSRLTPARLFRASGKQSTVAFQRRYRMKDGTTRWNPGKLNPDILRPAGPTDPEVAVVYAESLAGQPIAAYINYAIHLDTAGGLAFSADLVATLSAALRQARGDSLVTLFSMGCAGNINHIDTTHARPQSGHHESARIGTHLAAAVLDALADATEVIQPVLRSQHRILTLDAVLPTPAELHEARQAIPQSGNTMLLARAARTLEVAARAGRPFEAEVQILRIGSDLAWVGLPGEIFVELGLQLKAAAQIALLIPSTQTNGALGYIPHREAYSQGGYEVISSRLVPGSGEALMAAALDLLRQP